MSNIMDIPEMVQEIKEATLVEWATTEAMYQSHERTTLDNEWTEEELKGCIYDTCTKHMDSKWCDKYKNRALMDRNLLLKQYMVEKLCTDNDVIEIYNREYGKNVDKQGFGINWFDEWTVKQIDRLMRENIVT